MESGYGPRMNRSSDRIKQSKGIALCRFNGSRPEILLVCKRYTYAFNNFAHGKYNSNDAAGMINLFSGMTVDEKLDILSLRFEMIWYRVWLDSPRSASYYTAKHKFEDAFVMDGGVKLRKLINKSSNSQRLWEIPKGRKKNKNEPDINCAIREFYEETCVAKKSYRLFPKAKRTYSYTDGGIKYINTYYIAYTKHNIEPRINFEARDQLDEVSDIRWMSIDEIRFSDPTGRLEDMVKPIFNYVKKHARK